MPDQCRFEFEFRVIPGEDPNALVEEIVAYARGTLEPEMRAIAPDSELTHLAQRFAGSNGYAEVDYGTEAGRFKEMLGIETIICGPGRIAEAHRPGEYIEVAQLRRCDAFLASLIDWAANAR